MLPDQEGNRTCLENLRGKWVVLYFYPRDNTPGCSLEAKKLQLSEKGFRSRRCDNFGSQQR
ncbi:redoxin domain-containing protein [Methanosarcina horonobensis]|uniref:redoxin domain-containing protein n=1 Tax=Methanosarcina horonobensis TaxID=418008 RepID=UPI000A82C653|nr:redoxin domain-containing protein [Methanosarcina horonobensis]